VLKVPGFPSETFIAAQFVALLERGIDVHVVCEESRPGDWNRHSNLAALPGARDRVHASRLADRPREAGTRLALALLRGFARRPRVTLRYVRAARGRSWAETLGRLVRGAWFLELQPDVIHFEFGTQAVANTYLPQAVDAAAVVSLRGFDVNYSGLDVPGFYDDVWREVDLVHCNGTDLWRRAVRRGCPPDKPHRLISPAVNAEFFRPRVPRRGVLGDVERPVILVSVGRLHWKKGYEWALAAVASLRERGLFVDYRVLGGGPYEDAVRACVADLGLEDCVRLLGSRPREVVLDQMRAADVFVHASVSEGFSNGLLEAQAMELPAVSSDADGARENLCDGETGFVVPRRDPEALADKVLLLAREPELRLRMGRAGRRRVLKHFRPQDQTDAFLELYEHALRVRAGLC
jgi:colanic acid/amylovoran biosynthesis glycosyltransferase